MTRSNWPTKIKSVFCWCLFLFFVVWLLFVLPVFYLLWFPFFFFWLFGFCCCLRDKEKDRNGGGKTHSCMVIGMGRVWGKFGSRKASLKIVHSLWHTWHDHLKTEKVRSHCLSEMWRKKSLGLCIVFISTNIVGWKFKIVWLFRMICSCRETFH